MTRNVNLPEILSSLGAGKTSRHVLSSSSLVLVVVFYFFVLGSTVQPTIYTFENRVTYENIFVTHAINPNVDTLILLSAAITWFYVSVDGMHRKVPLITIFSVFLLLLFLNFVAMAYLGGVLTLPFISSLIIVDGLGKKRVLQHDRKLSLNYITIMAIVLASCGIISLFLYVITGAQQVTIEKYPYAIYHKLFSILSPIIMAALVFCVPLKVILNGFISKIKMTRHDFLLGIVEDKLSTKRISIYLSLCVMLGVGLAFIPHLSTVNPNNVALGVDSRTYVDWLNLIKNQTGSAAQLVFRDISSGDRPLTMIIIFLITETTRADPFQVVEYSPLLLTPLLVMVTFFLTRQITANDKISIIASFLSAISFQTLVGIYSGFYANWLALILGYFAFILLVKCLNRPSKFSIIALALIMTGVLLAHVHTWSIMISVAFVFLLVLHILNYYPRKHIFLVYLILSSSIAVDILKSSLTGSLTGLEADVSIGFSHGLGISQFSERLGTLADTVQTYYGGVYANIVILSLAVYWLVRCQPREPANIFLLIFMSTALIPLFIGDWVLQSRVLYDIPFQIPAAISLYSIAKKNGKMIFIALLLITGYLSLHVLANLGYVSPSDPLTITR